MARVAQNNSTNSLISRNYQCAVSPIFAERTQTSGTTQRESIWLLRHDTATHRLVLQFSAAINAFWRQAWREVCYELSASI